MKTLNELLILVKSVAENRNLEVKPDFDDLDERDEFFGRVWFDGKNNGICDNLNNAARHYNGTVFFDGDYASDWLKDHFDTWEHFSGDYGFPVEVPGIKIEPQAGEMFYSNAKRQYFAGMLWTNEAYDLRISLLNHLIECTNENM